MKCEYQQYLAHDFALCDIPPGTKGPVAKSWNQKGAPFHGRNGAGLCHAYSKTCAVDVDHLDHAIAWLTERGIDLTGLLSAPDHVGIVSGKPGRAKVLYRLESPLPSLKLCPYKVEGKTYHALELRCGTKELATVQDCLPPTIHPEMLHPYEWSYGDALDAHWSNIPPIPPALEALWRQSLAAESPAAPLQAAAPQAARYPEMQRWLNTQDPDAPYDEWLKIGARIHHETQGSDDGLRIFDLWSQRGKKYGVTKDGRAAQMPRDKWKTYDSSKPNAATFGGALREQVALPTDFAVVETADTGTDTRPDQALIDLLEKRLVFVRSQELYYDLASAGQATLSDRAIRHVFCPQVPWVKTTDKETGEIKATRPDPVKHLQFSKTKTIVDAIGMHPGAGRIFAEDGTRYVNSYQPPVIELLDPTAPEIDVMRFLRSRITDPTIADWVFKFFAHMVQKPGHKIRSAPLLVSAEQGTGKNTLMRIIPEILFGTKYCRTMSGDVLGGQFNGPMGSTWYLYLDELRAGNTKADRVRTTNKLKSWVTDDALEIHMKGVDPFEIRNRIQVGATSNYEDALQLDNNDRRWGIGQMVDHMFTPAEGSDVYDFLLSPRAPGVLRKIFLSMDITGFNPDAKAPDSGAKRTMVTAGLGAWESQLIELMVDRTAPFDRDIFTLQDVLASLPKGISSINALGRLLRQKPFRCAPLRRGVSDKRYWAWLNIAKWENDCTEGQRSDHVATGRRPFGSTGWSEKVPKALLAMTPESDVDSDSENSDLLG